MLDTPSSLQPAYRIKKKSDELNHNKLHNTNELKQRLMGEMLELDKQKQQLEMGEPHVDFSMLQTYKEMIQSRRVFLEQLNRSIK